MRQAGNEGDGPLAKAFHRSLFDQGWWGVGWPKEFGGMGKAAVEQYVFIDEMQMAGAPAMNLSITSVAPTILREGTDAQKATWLPQILRGDIEFAVAYSEPNAGTDLAALSTRAELDGDEWVINGQKIWNTPTPPPQLGGGAHRPGRASTGHSMIIVPMDRPASRCRASGRCRTSTNAVFFDNVPAEGSPDRRPRQGFYYAMMALDFERIQIGCVGMLARLLEELKDVVRRTTRDGRVLGAIPWVRRAIADLEMRVEVGRQIGLLNAWLIDQGIVPTKEGSMSKVYVSELNAHFASVGLDILGLAGQLGPNDETAPLHGRLQWLYTIAPMQRFGGGTNEKPAHQHRAAGSACRSHDDLAPTEDQQAVQQEARCSSPPSCRERRLVDQLPAGGTIRNSGRRSAGSDGSATVCPRRRRAAPSLVDLGLLIEECGRAVAPFGTVDRRWARARGTRHVTPQKREWLPASRARREAGDVAITEAAASANPAASRRPSSGAAGSSRPTARSATFPGVTAAAFLVAACDGRGVSAVLRRATRAVFASSR
jgi:alkylation response protein AidB-like acyl-CoA dehydrogenase